VTRGITKSILIYTVGFCMICSASAYAAGAASGLYKAKGSTDRNYFLILFGFRFLLPEVVNLDFNDNGTFSLSSDLFDMPAEGSYNKNLLMVKGQGSTGKFYDIDFEEDIRIDYTIVGLPIGLQGFYLMGVGKRDFTFYADDFSITETFIFQGPGLKSSTK